MYYVMHSTLYNSNFESRNKKTKTNTIMKKLFRIKNENAVLGGVALGLSEYLNVDVTILRIFLVVGFFTPVPVVLPYLIAWAIMPKMYHLLPQ
jgi:phage shock protein C